MHEDVFPAFYSTVPLCSYATFSDVRYRRGADVVLSLCEEELGAAGDSRRVIAALQCLEAWVILPSGPLTPDVVSGLIGRILELVVSGEQLVRWRRNRHD